MTEESKWKWEPTIYWCDKHQRWTEDIFDLRMLGGPKFAYLNCERSCYDCEFRKAFKIPRGIIV